MPLVLRSPKTHAAAAIDLEKAIREIAEIVWAEWRSSIADAYSRAANGRADKSIGEKADPRVLPPEVKAQLDRAQRALVGRMTHAKIASAVDNAGDEVQRASRSYLDGQIEKEIGKRFRSAPRIGDALRRYRAEAIRRISSVRDTVIPKLTKDVAHAYANGWSAEHLAKHWETNGLPVEFGTVEGRARVIAASELGRLNMHVTHEVHRALGIKSYRWRHSGKANFRPLHKGYDGKSFDWDKPPPGGHPGNQPGCGCGSDAVIGDDALDLLREKPPGVAPESPNSPASARVPQVIPRAPVALPQPSPAAASQAYQQALEARRAAFQARAKEIAEEEAARQARLAAAAREKAAEVERRAALERARHEEARRKAAEELRRTQEAEELRKRIEAEAAQRKIAEERARAEEARKRLAEEAAKREAERVRAEALKRAQEEAARRKAEAEALAKRRAEEIATKEAEAAEARRQAAARLEAERKAAEAKRLEAERKAAEAKRLEAERKADQSGAGPRRSLMPIMVPLKCDGCTEA